MAMTISVHLRRDTDGNPAPVNEAWLYPGAPDRILPYVGTLFGENHWEVMAFGETPGDVTNQLREHQLKMEGRL